MILRDILRRQLKLTMPTFRLKYTGMQVINVWNMKRAGEGGRISMQGWKSLNELISQIDLK